MDLPFKFSTDTLEVMNLLQKRGHMKQLLILLYSAIDTLAWVGLSDGDVTRTDFKDWVTRYLLPGSPLRCTADDLYSARCGLVHAHTSESSSTGKGTTRQIWYYGKSASEELLKNQIGNRTNDVAVRVLDLMLAFSDGAFRCIEDIAEDPRRSKKALERAARWMRWVPLEAQTPDATNDQNVNAGS